MKTVGIIAEYNPFHNGHRHHVEKSRELTDADCVVAVMSGNFTQRGEAAILDKWTRARIAVENGVDLVLELPFVFACSRAERFATGGVDILAELGVDWISFGSESGNLEHLQALTEDLRKYDGVLSEERQRFMQEGNSYAKSNELAVREILGVQKAALLLEPNNILALEYLKRISCWQERGHAIKPVTVKRHGSGYFAANAAAGFAGASYIRTCSSVEEIRQYVPQNSAEAMEKTLLSGGDGFEEQSVAGVVWEMENRFFQLVRSEIVKSSQEELGKIYCMGEGLEHKLKKEIIHAESLQELVEALVSRRYPAAAMKRLLVYVLLGIRERELPNGLYARVLAAGPGGRSFLRELKKKELVQLPIITNVNRHGDLCKEMQKTLQYDLLASDIYHLISGRDLYSFSDRVMTPYMK